MPKTTPKTLADLQHEPARQLLPGAGLYWNLDRARSYALAARGEFPCPVHRLGGRYYVLTSDVARALGLDPALLLTAEPARA